MGLVLERLENAHPLADGRVRAACPACREVGSDKTGDHLFIQPDGRFGCAKNPGDKQHRARIFALAGEPKKERSGNSTSRMVATYDYTDEHGKLLFQVCRFDPKDFSQRTPDGRDGWNWTTKGVRRVLYRLPAVLGAVADGERIFIAEGEKDVLALENVGFAATCNPGGAGKWLPDYSETLKGANVCIIADADKPGIKHAETVAKCLQGVAAAVRVIELPGAKDPYDFFASGGTAEKLSALVEAAQVWSTPGVSATVEIRDSGIQSKVRGRIVSLLLSDSDAATIRKGICDAVVDGLGQMGRFYFHADLRDFDSAMFFDGERKRLSRIRSDSFVAWLSDFVSINRAEIHFRHIQAAVETAALSSSATSPIVPEAFWASRPGVIYLSNGDGQVARIDGDGIRTVDNGTDGVLFAAGKSLLPWRLTEPRDVFETCRLFKGAHADANHGRDLLRLWVYSLASNPRSKPPLCLSGEVGSGKTRTIKGIAELYGLPFHAQKVEETGEKDFWPCINDGGLYCLDNADTRCRWLPDAAANAATDGCSQRRRLYTNSETVTLRARAWLALTTANPTFASDAGLADRLLLVRMARRGEESSDSALTEEISSNRDAGLSHIARTLQHALADRTPVQVNLNHRHPDFATFAVRIGRALGRESQAIAALRAAEADKSAFCLENDTIGAALLIFLNNVGSFTGSASELLPKLIEVDSDLQEGQTPKRLGKRLSRVWPHLVDALGRCEREPDRNGIMRFRFQAKPAGSAGFPERISQNPPRV